MIEKVKSTEQARSEYRFISAFEMDALYYGREKGRQEGRQEGIQEGLREGMQAGIAEGIRTGIEKGSYQTKCETARLMKSMNYPINDVCTITGLSAEEIEKL